MRAYTVATTAVTLGVGRKWVDNVLSHHRVPGVLQEKQGIVRRVTPVGLLTLDLAITLVRSLAIPIAEGLEMAHRLIAARGTEIQLPGALSIRLRADVSAVARDLENRLARAVEMSPTPKRGRPRRK